MDLKKIRSIYFIGIGGIGMSAVAGIAAARGFEVSGSDSSDIYEPAKSVLERYGISYAAGYAAENFKGADLAVVSGAVGSENPELRKVEDSGVEIISYPELLAAFAAEKQRIVIAGTNGKGTTSGLLGFALKNLNDSSFFVGGVLTQENTNFYLGSGPQFVIEGDEYRARLDDSTPKFMYYRPDVLLLNNLELDHPDIYADLAALKKVFSDLIAAVPETGMIVYNADDSNLTELISAAPVRNIKGPRLLSFGFENKNAAVQAGAPMLKDGFFRTEVRYDSKKFNFESILPGKIYAYNNLAAISVLLALGFEPAEFLEFVKDYQGLKRRFEIRSEHGPVLIEDYAHHPTAVLATLRAAKEKYPDRRLIAVFEPHTYSRTKELLPELVQSFEPADIVLISEVYPAREQKTAASVTGQDVVDAVSKHRKNVNFVANQVEAGVLLRQIQRPEDVIVVMSVGPYNVL